MVGVPWFAVAFGVTLGRRQVLSLAPLSAVHPHEARAAAEGERQVVGGASFLVPADSFTASPALIKTHAEEATFKYTGPRAAQYKYFKAGLTVDPVRIGSLREFDTAAGVGDRVARTERAKDGVVDVVVEEAREDGPYYRVRYVVDSAERGKKRYESRFAVASNKLVVLTAEAYVRYWNDEVEQLVKGILDSLEVAGAK